MMSPYPIFISYVLVAMNVSVDQFNFEATPYYVMGDDTKVIMDDKVRKSQMCEVPVPELTQITQSIINGYFTANNLDMQYAHATPVWRVLRYNQSGHFIEHKDKVRPIDGFQHFGTEILLPPKSQVDFAGGELTYWINGSVKNILPHATQWTHIIMPLGILHKVQKITRGTRISYVKSIYIPLKSKTPQAQATNQNNGDL